MNDDITKDLTDSEKLNLILTRLTTVEDRLSRLEDDRARETKPLLGEIRKEVSATRADIAELSAGQGRIEAQLKHVDRKFNALTKDMMDLRAWQQELDDRVAS